jgi:histidyl-tRNA synthetase
LQSIKRIKGTQDILPGESLLWAALEQKIRAAMQAFNFQEIRTPLFEQTELFARSIGQLTDIVSKEMYTFEDRGHKKLTLKPEMTAPVMRAFIENTLYARSPVNKLFYISALFRQENPQAGRLRQFHQFGAETLGVPQPSADAEIIDLALTAYEQVGLKNLQLRINSVGDPLCRVPYKKTLQNYIEPHLADYCPDCQRRFEENPMRILDCKNERCASLNQQAPKISQHLCDACADHYRSLQNQLQRLGIAYTENPYLVRGLDYYTRTVFEITSEALGAQNAICGGGRYDLLAEELGGPPTPAVGFASGIERLLMIAAKQEISITDPSRLDVYFVALGADAQQVSLVWLKKMRSAGLTAESDLLKRSLKAQMREANRQRARFAVILGEDELREKSFNVKLLDDGRQFAVSAAELITFLNRPKNSSNAEGWNADPDAR